MLPTSVEFWAIIQIIVDLCLIVLFIVFVRQVKVLSDRSGASGTEHITDTLEPVLRDAQEVAGQFEVQLKEKQNIVRRLNEHLDSRIISLNLLLNRAEASLASGGSEATRHKEKDVCHLQQEIITLSETGLSSEKIANRLGIAKGEVSLVLGLRKRFQEMDQA
ncbi:MAG: hypothetical protein IMF18_04160 [Proteobacteria bacterium]|nr:hypothetical protein [Pseudomonadota bacterium]